MNASSRMQQHALEQGSAAWLAHRMACLNASDAAAMLGCSPYTTRSQLLHRLHTGLTPEVDESTQRLYDDGHRTEALLRPLAEEIIGDELYPIVGTREWPGITRPLGASYDGLTLPRDAGHECKRLNEALRAALPHGDAAENDQAALPLLYLVQVEQQFMVCPTLERILFGAAEFDREGNLIDARWVWCTPNREVRAQIVGGWQQFEADLAAYVPPAAATPAAVSKVVAHLPVVLDMRVEGKLVSCNLEKYKPAALAYIEAINTQLTSDQQFADADADAKFCRESADKLELSIEQALGQMGDINAALNTVREIAAAFDAKGLALEKLVKAEKERRKGEIVAGGISALREHCAALTKRLGRPYLPTIPADFARAIYGKKSLSSMEEAVATELARAKIEANRVADLIDANLRTIENLAGSYTGMFPDAAGLVLKSAEDCEATVRLRVDAHEKRLAADRERIRAEEAARADREAQARAAQERRQQEEAARAAAPPPTPAPTVAPAPVANVLPMQRPAPAPASLPTLRLGQINERIAPLSIDAAGLAALGFPHSATDKAAKLYFEHQFHGICAAIAQHAVAAANRQKAA